MRPHSGTIDILWYEMLVLWVFIINLKNNSTALNVFFLNRCISGLPKEVLKVIFGQVVSKLQVCKICGQKEFKTFWVRGYFVRNFTIINLVFRLSRFDSKTEQTLRPCFFAALWPARTYDTFFERSDIYLYGKTKIKDMKAFWWRNMPPQTTLTLLNKVTIVPEWDRHTVESFFDQLSLVNKRSSYLPNVPRMDIFHPNTQLLFLIFCDMTAGSRASF